MISLQELKKMTAKDLLIELKKFQSDYGKMRLLFKSGQDKASHKQGGYRRAIAQIQTLLSGKNHTSS
jgi:ribosomal protein L29